MMTDMVARAVNWGIGAYLIKLNPDTPNCSCECLPCTLVAADGTFVNWWTPQNHQCSPVACVWNNIFGDIL